MPHVREREPNPDDLPEDDPRKPARPGSATRAEDTDPTTGDADVDADAAMLDASQDG